MLRAGERVGRDRVRRLMKVAGLEGAKRRGSRGALRSPIPMLSGAPTWSGANFTASAPNRLWVAADMTHLRSWEGISFLAFVTDVFSRMIGGWPLACMRSTLVLDALRMVLWNA